MEQKQLLDQIDLAFPEYLQLWKDICNIESPSADRVGVNLVADHIAAFCKGKGYAVTRQPTPAGGDMLLIELPGKSDKAPVALMAHMDTVHQKGALGILRSPKRTASCTDPVWWTARAASPWRCWPWRR